MQMQCHNSRKLQIENPKPKVNQIHLQFVEHSGLFSFSVLDSNSRLSVALCPAECLLMSNCYIRRFVSFEITFEACDLVNRWLMR